MSKMQDDKDYKSAPEAPIKANNIVNFYKFAYKRPILFLVSSDTFLR